MDSLSNRSWPPDRNKEVERILIAIGLVGLLLTLGPTVPSDGEVRYKAIETWLGGGSTRHIKFSLVQPVPSTPLAWIAKIFSLPQRKVVAHFNLIVVVLGAAYPYRLVAERYSPRVARIGLIVLGSASMLPHHLQWYFGEVLTSVLLAIGVLIMRLLFLHPRHAALLRAPRPPAPLWFSISDVPARRICHAGHRVLCEMVGLIQWRLLGGETLSVSLFPSIAVACANRHRWPGRPESPGARRRPAAVNLGRHQWLPVWSGSLGYLLGR